MVEEEELAEEEVATETTEEETTKDPARSAAAITSIKMILYMTRA